MMQPPYPKIYLLLQVRFAIEVLGLNVAKPFRFTGVQDQCVGWEKLILFDTDDLADLHIPPENLRNMNSKKH